MFGDPFNAVLSIWKRGYQFIHEESMSFGKHWFNSPKEFNNRIIKMGMPLQDYLRKGVDAFHLGEHIDNWVHFKPPANVKILLVKYESLRLHIEEVLSFLECDRPFEVKDRTSDWTKREKPIQRGLQIVYGAVKAKVDRLPSILRKNI
jgi:hypothetical protein